MSSQPSTHDNLTPAPSAPAAAPTAGRDLALLLLTCLALWGWNYGFFDFWGPDEPRYVQIARELLGRSNWLVLTIMGKSYDQKPPLPYWMMATALKLNGGVVSSWAVRIPALLFGVMTVLLTYLIGRARLGRRAGWLGAWVLLTSVLFIEEVPVARLDMLLTGFMALAMYAWLGALPDDRPMSAGRLALFWAGVTGAFLIKGPVVLAVVLGTVAVEAWLGATAAGRPMARKRLIQFWALIAAGAILVDLGLLTWAGWLLIAVALGREALRARSWGALWRVRPGLGLLIVGLVIAAWLVSLGFFVSWKHVHGMLLTATVERVENPTMHRHWLGYYIPSLLGDGFPVWSLAMLAGLAALWRRRDALPADWPRLRPILVWFVWPFLFFSIVPTKREQYLLPVYPAMALLTGWILDRYYEQAIVPRWARRAGAALAAALGLALIVLGAGLLGGATPGGKHAANLRESLALIHQAPLFAPRAIVILLFGALLAASAWVWLRAARVQQASRLFMTSVLFGGMVALGCGAPLLNQVKSTRPINMAIAAQIRQPGEVVGALGDTYKAQNQVYGPHRLTDLQSGPQYLEAHQAELPRIIIGENDDKKFKAKVLPVLKRLGYQSVYQASPQLERLGVFVRQGH